MRKRNSLPKQHSSYSSVFEKLLSALSFSWDCQLHQDSSPMAPSPRDPLAEDIESEISVSSPDSSPIPNSIELSDEVTCEHSFEEAIQKLFGEAKEQVQSKVVPHFFKKVGINLVQISGSQ